MRFILITIFLWMNNNVLAETLVLATISSNPTKILKQYRPIAYYLQNQLKGTNITQVKILSLDSQESMIHALKNHNVDLYFDSPFISIKIAAESGASLFLRQWKNGEPEYKSVIFSRKDKGISYLSDLVNKTIVFEEDFSTSSYLLPKASLIQEGYALRSQNATNYDVRNEIKYVFSHDDENTMFWILRNKYDAGAMSDSKFRMLSNRRSTHLKIIYESIAVPRHVISHRANFSPLTLKKISDILISMNSTVDGKKALFAFSKTAKFDTFPGGADTYFQPLKQLMAKTNLSAPN